MYAAFREDDFVVPAIQVPQGADYPAEHSSYVMQEEISAQRASPEHPSDETSSTNLRVETIATIRAFILQFSGPPPIIWRRYRYNLPSTVAEVRLLPASIEVPQLSPSTAFFISLNTTPPEGGVYDYCSQLIEYVMTHVKHVNGDAPLLGLRFVKVGAEIAQCVVTIGNNNVSLARTVVGNLNQVGLQVAFAAPKPINPTATLYVWDLSRRKFPDTPPLTAEEIQAIFEQPLPPGAAPGTQTVSVIQGFEEGVWYVCFKRPDPCFNWLMNTLSSFTFQKELYESLGLLVTLATCEHDWAPPRRTPGGLQYNVDPNRAAYPNSAHDASGNPLRTSNADGNNSEDDQDDEEAAESFFIKSNIDIFGGKETTAAAAASNSDFKVPEIVADEGDSDDEQFESDGILANPMEQQAQQQLYDEYSAGVYDHGNHHGMMYYPPPPPPPNGSAAAPPYMSTMQQGPSSGGLLPGPSMHSGILSDVALPPPPAYGMNPSSMFPAPILSFGGNSGGLFPTPMSNSFSSGFLQAQPNVQPSLTADEERSDFLTVPDIIVPTTYQPAAEAQREALISRLATADPRRVTQIATEPESYKILMDLLNESPSGENALPYDDDATISTSGATISLSSQSKIEALVGFLLQPLPAASHKLETMLVIDSCWHERTNPHAMALWIKVLQHQAAGGLRATVAKQALGHLHQPHYRRICEAILDADKSDDNPLISAFCQNLPQWCTDVTAALPKHVVNHPHLMIPFGLVGLHTMFRKSSDSQRARINFCFQSLSSEAARDVMKQSEMVARTLLATAALCDVIDSEWLLEKFGTAPDDNHIVGLIVDLACVVVYGRGDTLISNAIIEFAGKYCAVLDMTSSVTDDVRLDFLHNAILRRLFSPAQAKYTLFQKSFFEQLDKAGGQRTSRIASVLASSTWPKRPHVTAPVAKGITPAGGLLPVPAAAATSTPLAPSKQAEVEPICIAYAWNETWTSILAEHPPVGEPFPPLPSEPESSELGATAVWKFGVSRSYGHYYFKLDDKSQNKVKSTYKHPETHKEYMVAPQAFVIAAERDNEFVRESFLLKYQVSEDRFRLWLADQRQRDREVDEAVMKEMKITYRQSSSSSTGTSATKTDSSKSQHDNDDSRVDASAVLRAQRELQRKLKFVQDLKYPSKGHPFPALPPRWTCSLSASNGLYYYRHEAGRTVSNYEHPVTRTEYAPTPQAYAFFEGFKEHTLQQKLEKSGVTKERITAWLSDQTVRDLDIDHYVVEKIGVRYDNVKRSKRGRSRDSSVNRR